MESTRGYCQFLMKAELSEQVLEKYSDIKFTKIHLVGAELFHTPTDMTHLTFALRNLGNAPKK
jgi:hypothetical protein